MLTSDSTVETTLNFKIQLLAGKNVVLVECAGFESELFMPQIIKGRINFKNIIPSRRCCDSANMSSSLITNKCGLENNISTLPMPSNVSVAKRTYNQTGLASPLAKSTPSSTSSGNGKENILSSLPTPDQVRGVPHRLPSINHMMFSHDKSSSPSLTPEPRNLYPLDSVEQTESDQIIFESQLADMNTQETKPKTVSIRTYSRCKSVSTNICQQPSIGSCKSKSNTVWNSPLQKKKKSLTKTPNPTMKLEVRNRKLIVDTNKSLGYVVSRKMVEAPITKKRISKKQVTAKTRKQYCALKGTAYDLLTTPSITNISNKLVAQFRLACMDKTATTLPSYAQIANVPPLFVDREVRSLLARQKRLQKGFTM